MTILACTIGRLRALTETPRSDRELLDAHLGGDPLAFSAIVRRHGSLVLGVCRRVLGHEQDAEDAFQAAFVVLARRASAIRKGESLASFLHGVSYRIAVRARRDAARRRRRETRSDRPDQYPPPAIAWNDLQAILDEETQRLPAIYRDVFVGCCMQGQSKAAVARTLGLKEGTVSSRLVAARQRLQQALSRRGITLSALAAPAVPTALVDAASAGVSGALTPRILELVRGELLAGPTLTARWVALLGLAFLGVGALALGPRTAAHRPALARADTPAARAESSTIAGKVVDPDGKPVAGARLYLLTNAREEKPKTRASTDALGAFSFTLDRSERDSLGQLVAIAKGYGPDWRSLRAFSDTVTLCLVKDDVPINGRIVDLEGQPVAGARVRISSLYNPTSDEWKAIETKLAGRPEPQAVSRIWWRFYSRVTNLHAPASFSEVVTGKDGRFQINGLGRDRLVRLQLDGPNLAQSHCHVLTRPRKEPLPDAYLPTFTHAAAPGRAIEGLVKDRKTGKPLAGVRVVAQPHLEGKVGAGIIGRTDREGKFHIAGVPKARSYHVTASQSPYIWTSKDLADAPGLGTLTTTLELDRALALRVRVIDAETGKPVRAYVQYTSRSNNPALERYPTYPRNVIGWEVTNADGWNTTTAIPGPAIVAVQAIDGEYTVASFKGAGGDERFVSNVLPGILLIDNFHAMTVINLDKKDPKTLEMVIRLNPGRSVKCNLVDPDGKPITDVLVAGRTAVWKAANKETEQLSASACTVVGLDPKRPRTVVFYHPGRKLARAVTLRGDEKGVQTIQLARLGAVEGKLVDAAGKPVEGSRLLADVSVKIRSTLPSELVMGGRGALKEKVTARSERSGRDGAFKVEGLIPGLQYDGWVTREKQFTGPVLSVTPKAGGIVDLGTVKVVQKTK